MSVSSESSSSSENSSSSDSEGRARGEYARARGEYGNGDASLRYKLRGWAINNNCTRECVNQLLQILIHEGLDLPKDKRTLLKTKSSICSQERCGGNYIYNGIVDGLTKKIIEFVPKSPI